MMMFAVACSKNTLELGNNNLKFSDVLKCVMLTDEEIQMMSVESLKMIFYNNELICEQ